MIKLTTKNFDKLTRFLSQEEKCIFTSMTKAHSSIASNAATKLKRGLSDRHGRDYKADDYAVSPKGALPYAHTMRLRDSIGFKLLAKGNTVFSEVGSGSHANPVKYANYLEGENGNGIRPFLWYIEPIYNVDTFIKKFWQYYNGGKAK